MSGRRIRLGKATGKAVVCRCPMSFLGGIDPQTGKILERECESRGHGIAGTVFCFPFGKGSTVGSYAMYQLRLNDLAPAAIVNESAEPIVATGAIIANIPMIDGVDVSLLRNGDDCTVDADEGLLEVNNVLEKHVVTSIVRNRRKILLLRRSDKVGSYKGKWAGVSGYIEHEEDYNAALREMEEEVGLKKVKLAKRIDPQRFRDGDIIWCVHAFLFDVRDPEVRIDWEHRSYEWVPADEVSKYPTVPGLVEVISKLLR